MYGVLPNPGSPDFIPLSRLRLACKQPQPQSSPQEVLDMILKGVQIASYFIK